MIRANKKVVVETLNWPSTPEFQGLQYKGVQVPCVQTVDVIPEVTLTPLEGGFPMTYIIIGAAITAISVLITFLSIRSRRKK